MQLKVFILLLLLCSFSCNQSVDVKSETNIKGTQPADLELKTDPVLTFDKSKWILKEGKDYPYRYEMLTDLLESHVLDSLHQDGIFGLLGQPDRIDNNHLFYLVAQKRMGFWPIHTKTLVIKLKDDGAIEWVRVHE